MAIKIECDRCRSQTQLVPPVLHDDNKDKLRPNVIVKHEHANDLELWLCSRCRSEVISDIQTFRRGASTDEPVDSNNSNNG